MTDQHPLLQQLNEPQQQAVVTIEGPSLILAGAGSGKTRALTHRIAYLMAQGVPPWQILAVTFTNKAASEMKERIKHLLGVNEPESVNPFSFGSGKLPIMGTFHSICARILRRDIEHIGRDRSFVIYDTDDQKKLLKEIIKEMGIDDTELKPKVVAGYIGRFKCEALTPKEAMAQASTSRMLQVVQAYERYQKALLTANALDFDDLLLETVRLFKEREDILDKYQETWRYLHVDEYQDTNHTQYLIMTMLAQKYRNLCVIGDPDQSIYAFRGADIRNILEFEKEYPEATHIKLEQNYRSTQTILDGADSVIQLNPDRPEKKMWTEQGQGEKILLHEVTDEKREAKEVIEHIKKAKQAGTPYNEQVILYRTNAQSRLFEEACMRAAIPYRIIGGTKFYARKEVKDVLAYMQVSLNPNDTIALLRIINIPGRKLGQTTIGKLQAYASAHGLTLWDTLLELEKVTDINGPTKERLQKFTELIQSFQRKKLTLCASELMEHIIEAARLEDHYRDKTEEGEARWGNIQELVTVSHKYDGLEPEVSIMSFLEEVSLVSEVDKLQTIEDDAVTLMTLHLCKGLEYDHVVIAGCEENIFPHSNALFDKAQLEEECRIMYVGMTRAKKQLTLTHASSRQLWGEQQANAPSRFLDELPEALIERRSDDVLSAFAWATESAQQKIWGKHPTIQSFKQHADHDEFNQDIAYEEGPNEDDFDIGVTVEHPTFGRGTILAKRGDILEIKFGNGTKNLALSIAPLKIIS